MINQSINRPRLVVAALGSVLLLVWTVRLLPWGYSSSWTSAQGTVSGVGHSQTTVSGSELAPHVESYFDQVFSQAHPKSYPYATLKETCDHVKWNEEDIYLKCGGMAAGLTSIVSQVKVCLKMAVESGSHIVLPAMPLRDSKNLLEFNFLNGEAYLTYDQWFDADHLREQMGKACPKMKIIHPDELDNKVQVKRLWDISVTNAWGYEKFHSYFWVGRPFSKWFREQYQELNFMAAADPSIDQTRMGITVVNIDSEFLLFKIMDDPTRRDLRLWNDLAHIVRFKEQPRKIIHQLLDKLTRPYYAVHFRVENDTIWSSLENQLTVDLDALDRAWERFGNPRKEKPMVYLACGDKHQVEKFVAAGAERGWEVTHKWRLTQDDPVTTKMINELPFDFQGAIDMGVMVRGQFFLGITGSAFSSTIANMRDPTGRYRGSSFDVIDDDGAHSHLFNDLDSAEYSCCL